ncbi:unnamed protein product [Phytomonas sp. Hart1]|nr:unnamed protein product [Phytomonas sp. Hart1]|eukprot:CCW66320.1 unnamed protein product [Phytomonas sp. isolate Hart1]
MHQSSFCSTNNKPQQTPYQMTNPFAVRCSKATMLRNIYSGCIPVIIEPVDHMWNSGVSYHNNNSTSSPSKKPLHNREERMCGIDNPKEVNSTVVKDDKGLDGEGKASSSSSCAQLFSPHPLPTREPWIKKGYDGSTADEKQKNGVGVNKKSLTGRGGCSKIDKVQKVDQRTLLSFFRSSPTLTGQDRVDCTSNSAQPEVEKISCKKRNTFTPPSLPFPSSTTFLCTQSFRLVLPMDKTVGEVILLLRERLALSPHEAIFLTVVSPKLCTADSIGFSMPPNNTTLGVLYEQYRNPDGFLYIAYCMENTFG